MFCRYCGKEIADESLFCEGCGKELKKAAEKEKTEPAPSVTNAPQEIVEEKKERAESLAEEAQEKKHLRINKLYKEWEAGCVIKKVLKGLRIARIALKFAVLFLFLTGVLLAFLKTNAFILVMALALLPVCFVCTAVDITKGILNIRSVMSFSVWLRDRGVDRVALLKESIEAPFDSMPLDEAKTSGKQMRDLILGEVYNDLRGERVVAFIDSILSEIFGLWWSSSAMFFVAFSAKWLESFTMQGFRSFFAVPNRYFAFLALLGIAVCAAAVSLGEEKTRKKAARKWMEKNAPLHLETYDKHVGVYVGAPFKDA